MFDLSEQLTIMTEHNMILAHILSSRSRAEIFRHLFGLYTGELHGREIQRRAGFAIGTIQQELKKLERLGLILGRRDGNRLYYRANRDHALYPEVHGLVLKTAGLVDVLREVLAGARVELAFVFGSVAQGAAKADSDVDLMIVGRISLRELSRRLAGAVESIGREINPYVISASELKKRRKDGEHFIEHVMKTPRLFVKGSEDELAAMGQ